MDPQWMKEDLHLGYLKFDPHTGICNQRDALIKLSALYHRTQYYAPWLLRPKATQTSALFTQRLKWVAQVITILFALSLSDVPALASFCCILLPYLHQSLPTSFITTYKQGKVCTLKCFYFI